MKLTLIAAALFLTGCSAGNLEYIKDNAIETFDSRGFEVTGYEGYLWGLGGINSYGGAKVWYQLRKVQDNDIIYTAYLWRWGEEIHMYNLSAVDAIKP